MSEEIERRLARGIKDKSSITEILDTTNDSIEEVVIRYKSGRFLVIKT